MRSELIDDSKYLSNRMDFIRLLGKIYKDTNLKDVVDKYGLTLVGGQALAFWHYHYFHNNPSVRDYHYSFSDDIDFYGKKFGLEFLRDRLSVDIKTPENFDSTVSLGIFTIETETFPDGVAVDIIHSVGGLDGDEITKGTEVLHVEDFDFPIINPLLCLKSRIHNFYAVYKPDKIKEINRVEISIRVCEQYFDDILESGWSREASRYCESILEIARSRDGVDLFIKNGVDVTKAINLENPNINNDFKNIRFPKSMDQIFSNREKRERHLERFGGLSESSEKPAVNVVEYPRYTPSEILAASKCTLPSGDFGQALFNIYKQKTQEKDIEPE